MSDPIATASGVSTAQATDQLRAFIDAIFEPTDLVELRAIHKTHKAKQKWLAARDLSSLVARLGQLNGTGFDIYIGANPRKAIGGSKADDVLLARCLFVDFDGIALDEVRRRIDEAGLPTPTMIVRTGHGFHCYWRLDSPLHDLDEFTLYQLGLIAQVGSDPCIHDWPRILRLPPFVNHTEDDPAVCEIVESDPARQYSLDEFPRATPRPTRTTNPNGQVSQDERANALRYLGRLKAERADPRESWLAVGMCLHSVDQSDSMLDEWDRWSRQSDKWEDGACCEEWDTFHADGARTIASLNKWSTEDSPLVTAKIGGGVVGSTGQSAPSLSFDIERIPGRARAKITVMVDDNPIMVERLDVADSAKRETFAQAVHARDPQFDVDVIRGRLLEMVAARPPAAPSDDEDRASRDELLGKRDEQTERALAAMPKDVVADAEAMLADDQLIERVLIDIEVLGVVGERDLALAVYLIGTSRLLDRPLSAITQGTTSSGKSFVNKQIGQLFPPEAKLLATSITSQALYYLKPGRLIHCFIIAGERSRIENDELAEATRALREMQSDGDLTKVVTTTIAGCPVTKTIHQDGPISFCETTTLCRIFDEDANRALLLTTNEGKEQTALVKRSLAHNARYGAADTDRTIARHLALQRLLKRVRVTIPFAETLNESIPSDRTEARRATSHVLELIKVVALLHQRQRTAGKIEHGAVIEATVADYEIARTILLGPISRALGRALPPAATSLFERLQQRYGTETFTSPEAARDDSIITARNKMSEHLRTISDSTGALEIVEPGRGSKPHTWRITGELPDAGDAWLPYSVEMEDRP